MFGGSNLPCWLMLERDGKEKTSSVKSHSENKIKIDGLQFRQHFKFHGDAETNRGIEVVDHAGCQTDDFTMP